MPRSARGPKLCCAGWAGDRPALPFTRHNRSRITRPTRPGIRSSLMKTVAAVDPPLDDPLDDDPGEFDAALIYEAQTERLKVYAALLRVTIPRIGATTRLDSGRETEIDPDVNTARNLAIESIFADIRRIAGAGIHSAADTP